MNPPPPPPPPRLPSSCSWGGEGGAERVLGVPTTASLAGSVCPIHGQLEQASDAAGPGVLFSAAAHRPWPLRASAVPVPLLPLPGPPRSPRVVRDDALGSEFGDSACALRGRKGAAVWTQVPSRPGSMQYNTPLRLPLRVSLAAWLHGSVAICHGLQTRRLHAPKAGRYRPGLLTVPNSIACRGSNSTPPTPLPLPLPEGG